jgi:RNA polymerase sigma factor (sigma-70 family)
MTQDAILNTLISLQPAMQLAAEKMLHSEADAEDMVQDTVLELWERRDQLQHVLNLNAYAMQTVKNRCISFLRKHRDIATDDIRVFDNIVNEEVIAEAALIEERAAQLDSMMERLPAHPPPHQHTHGQQQKCCHRQHRNPHPPRLPRLPLRLRNQRPRLRENN